MTEKYRGTGVAVITPFRDGNVDFDALSVLIEYLIKGGVNFLVPLGSTGEAATLSEDEQQSVINHVAKINQGRLPIIAGNFGGNDTHALIKKLKRFDLSKVDAILSAVPSYVKPSQEGIYQHFMKVAENSPVDVFLYNVPSRTSMNMRADTVLRLARSSEKFIGVKEATGDISQVTQIIKDRPSSFCVTSGDDPTALATTAIGGDGVISVIGNAFPKEFSTMIHHALNHKLEDANRLNERLFDLHQWLYIDGNPAGIKAVLAQKGICKEELRLPLVPMRPDNKKALIAELEKLTNPTPACDYPIR